MSEALEPCLACARHLRVSAARCPFCGALRDAREAVEVEAAPLRAPRSALLVAGAALALAGCASTMQAQPYGRPPPEPEPSVTPPGPPDAGAAQPSAAPTPSVIAIYGAPPKHP